MKSKSVLVFGFIAILNVLASASPALALEERTKQACLNAFEGKCFHTNDTGIDLTTITSELDADVFCDSNPNHCGSECGLRLKVIVGVYPAAEKGNPCLPQF